jgi:hypothetical protein
MPDGVVTTYDADGHPRLQLALIPTPQQLPYDLPYHDHYGPQSGAFRFNDALATGVVVAGGTAILASIIAGIAQKH